MLSIDNMSNHFLKVRKELYHQNKTDIKPKESDKVLRKTNKISDVEDEIPLYRNNISDKDFEYILKKQLVYELDDYKTNYSYKQYNNVDPKFEFNLKIQEQILKVVNDKFYEKNNSYKFMRLINETFEIAIKLFIKEFKLDENDIKFIFYNDIILRKIAENFVYTLPNKSSINTSNYFEKYFNSELPEWYIILHPELENYEKIYSKLKFYIALIMKQLNKFITINKREIFSYFKYNEKYQQYINLELSSHIEQVLNNLKEYDNYKVNYDVENTKLIKNVHVYCHDEANVLLNNKADVNLFQINIKETEHKITYNQCMSFQISLNNTKIKNKSKIKQSIEHMVVPIRFMSIMLMNKTESFSKKIISSHKNSQIYSYVLSPDDIFKFEGISFKFICERLEETAYNEEPWIVQNWKYTYGRLLFYYLIDLFVNLKSNRIRNSIVTLSKQIVELIRELNKEFSKGDETQLKKIYEMLLRKYEKKYNVKLIILIKNIYKYNTIYKYNVKFKEFINFIDEILKKIENIFRSVYSYCIQSNDVLEEHLYKGNIKYVI